MFRADTSCILAWLIEQGYEVIAFMADVGQEEVCCYIHRFRAYRHNYGCRTLRLPARRP